MTRTVLDVLKRAIQENGDLYHLHDPELLPSGLILKMLGKRVVFDSHEHVVKDILTKPWMPAEVRRIVALFYGGFQQFATRFLDGVVVATDGIAGAFPGRNVVVVQNFPRVSDFEVSPEPYRTRPRRIAYVGAITEIRGIFPLVQAMNIIGEDRAARLSLVGSFAPPDLHQRLSREAGWQYVDAYGQLTREEVADRLSQARAGIVTLLYAPNHLDSQPNKLFEYMIAGIPIIASDFPYWRRFVEDHHSGLMVDPENPEAIAGAITWILNHPAEAEEMGRRGREAVLEHYTWESQERWLVEFYESILGRP